MFAEPMGLEKLSVHYSDDFIRSIDRDFSGNGGVVENGSLYN